jgi:hypothetical protein
MEEMMNKTKARVVAAPPEVACGSPAASVSGIDVSALYIDMLCERFKNRGIKTGLSEAKSAEIRKNAVLLGIRVDEVSASDEKYRTLKIDGKSYMSSDDFAAYYKDLRGYKLPKFYTRAENEYEAAEAVAGEVQETGKPPKKAVWLAIKRRIKEILRDFFSVFVIDEFRKHSEEEPIEGEKKRIPRGVLPAILVVTLSLLMVVCSSVMASRATASVGDLEDEIEALKDVKNDLEGDLVVKNDMLNIKDIAVNKYGMISSDYATSRYLDVTEGEKIERHEDGEKADSLLTRLLKAIGLVED